MSHRAFRLSISPDDHPEVSRVVDFDGRHSLHDVHEFMRDTLNIGDDDHLYAFFMSGKYWDQSSEYVDSRTEGPRADRALLFRLGLRAGNRFVYVYDYGEEQRYSLSVVSVTEIDAPLTSPVLVESAGEKPVAVEYDEDARPATDPAFQQSLGLATTVLEQSKALAESKTDTELETTRLLLRQLGETALQLLQALDGNLQLTSQIDEELEFELIECLLNLPERLYMAAETELAVRVAESLKYCAPDDMNGEIALAYANAGDRERALARVLTNLESPDEPFVAECKSGAVYRALGEADAAEAYYRRAFAIARTAAERRQATLRITSLLIDTGREVEAAAFIAQQKQAATSAPDANPEPKLPSVGRNDPCPCGSGKKYKKCHGT